MKKMVDIDFIKKWVNITEEELMQRLVKDAIGLQKEAEQNQRDSLIKERKADTLYDLAFIQKFFRQYKYLSKYFSGDEILAACKRHMDKSDLTRTETIRRYVEEDTQYYTVLDHGTYTFKEHRGTWERDVRDTGTKVLVSNQYQNIYGASDVVRDLLLQRCPYLNAYDMEIYEIDERNDWIYIKNPEQNGGYSESSLYVPFSALMEKDAEKIVETHRNYWHEYGCGKYDQETEKFLSSDFAREFLENVVSPDDEIGISDMRNYGYTWDGMYPLSRKKALELFDNDLPIYKLYNDGTEVDIDDRNEILEYSGMFGIEKHDWEKAK